MSLQSWQKPVDCDAKIDTSGLSGKTAVVTGGANGLGQAYIRALVAAGVNVCFGDMNAADGESLAAELSSTNFVKCDVRSWKDQLRLFKEAAASSCSGRIDYVVANAGISVQDDVFSFDGEGEEPSKPDLTTLDVNLHGVMYTVKLSMHYFIKQNGTTPSPTQQDTCLILIGSGAAFLDVPRSVQYCSPKWGARGVMHAMRRTAHFYGSRVNMISPWYVRTKILSQAAFDQVKDAGVEFATPEDGGQCLLRILSDPAVNGRTLFLSPRKWAKNGYLDLDLDEFSQEATFLQEVQADQIKNAPVELGLFP
ncbi:uncharacterized protein LTR77_000758 [Saxophila tyrrhenica]|uniref:Uncharacterized protein n=1 Tax=Saxophila tyrrhenica TaxID=1690608 RepID=A0AAV9PNX4_9PEZI|nr:hypothetical protein LTR77_000758 [Saxophila tyrrhenica]